MTRVLVYSGIAVAGVVIVVFAAGSVRVIRPYQLGLVERFGRYERTVGQGLRFVVPVLQTLRPVDMRQQVLETLPFDVVTADGKMLNIELVVYYRPTDVEKLVYEVANLSLSLSKLAQVEMAAIVAEMQADDALMSRKFVERELPARLKEAAADWGIVVTRVGFQRMSLLAREL